MEHTNNYSNWAYDDDDDDNNDTRSRFTVTKTNIIEDTGVENTVTRSPPKRKPPPLNERNSIELSDVIPPPHPPPAPTIHNPWDLPYICDPTNIWTNTNVDTDTDTSIYSRQIEPPFKYGKFSNILKTRFEVKNDGSEIKYLTINDILYHCTLGGTISDSYLQDITNHITQYITVYKNIEVRRNHISGVTFIQTIPVFSFEQYGLVAFRCLEWAISNPEKLSILVYDD